MLLDRKYTRCLLTPADVPASREDLKVLGVFNPGAVRFKGRTVLMVRVAEAPVAERTGYHALPRWDAVGGDLVVEWLAEEDDILKDPRKVVRRSDQLMRLKFVSHLRAYALDSSGKVECELGRFMPETDHEMFGVEDARLTCLDGRYYMTYVSVSEHGACTSLAVTYVFVSWERPGVIFCAENKDVVLFPEQVNGTYIAMHRPNTFQRFCKPEIWLAYSDDLQRWYGHRALWGGCFEWDNDRIGAGMPPLRTEAGWLEMYHGSRRAVRQGEVGMYCAGLMLLAGDDPSKVCKVTEQPVMMPSAPFEVEGFVNRVVFPTGWVLREDGDTVDVYYGGADTYVGAVGFSLAQMLERVQ